MAFSASEMLMATVFNQPAPFSPQCAYSKYAENAKREGTSFNLEHVEVEA